MFSETRYAMNGDLRVAYRASGEGVRDIVFVPNWFTCCELLPELPSTRGGRRRRTALAAAVRLGCGYLMTHGEAFPLGHTVNGVQVIGPRRFGRVTCSTRLPTPRPMPTTRTKAAAQRRPPGPPASPTVSKAARLLKPA